MAGDGVKIPVSVTGKTAAISDVRQVGQELRQLQEQAEQASSSVNRVQAGRAPGWSDPYLTPHGYKSESQRAKDHAAALQEESRALQDSKRAARDAGEEFVGLSKSRQGLQAILALSGSRMAGDLVHLDRLVQFLKAAGPQMLAFAGSVGVALLAIKYVHDYREAAEKAAQAQRDLNEAIAAAQWERAQELAKSAEGLSKLGALSPENEAAARSMGRRLASEYGVDDTGVVSLAVAAGLSDQDAARLSVLMRGGVSVGSAKDARKVLEKVAAQGESDAVLQEAVTYAMSGAGLAVRTKARVPGAGGRADIDAVQRVFEALKESGGEQGLGFHGLPKDMTLAQFRELAGRFRGVDASTLADAQRLTVGSGENRRVPWYNEKEFAEKGYKDLFDAQSTDLEALFKYAWVGRMIAQNEALQTSAPRDLPMMNPPAGMTPSGEATRQVIQNITNVTNIDSAYMVGPQTAGQAIDAYERQRSGSSVE